MAVEWTASTCEQVNNKVDDKQLKKRDDCMREKSRNINKRKA